MLHYVTDKDLGYLKITVKLGEVAKTQAEVARKNNEIKSFPNQKLL